MTGHQPQEALLELLAQPLASRGLDLEGVEVSTAGRRRLVRVMVDMDGGVTLDEIAEATRLVNAELDQRDDVVGGGPYTLEVTSPGVDRPLTLPRHWSRNVDRLVVVTPHEGAAFTGRITAAGESSATVDVDGTPREVAYESVARARIEIEFNRPKATGRPGAAEED